jgi:hypothetical protein
VLVHVHDCLPSSAMTEVVHWFIRRGADVIVANSEYTARWMLGGAASRAKVLHNPVLLARFSPDRVESQAARRDLDLDMDAPLMGVVAQITPWKGQDLAIRVLAEVRKRLPTARLVLVGEITFDDPATRYDNREYLERLKRLAAELEVDEAVEFLGAREDVEAVLAAVDITLVPSIREPFGRIVVESMAMGRPVLAANSGGPSEILTDGREGRLLPEGAVGAWATAATDLLCDPAAREAMGARGRRRAADFGGDIYAAKVVSAYRVAAASPPRVGMVAARQRLKQLALPRPGSRKLPLGPARGVRMEIDFAHQTRLYLGLYETELNPHLRAFSEPGQASYDVGANVGYDALVLAKLNRGPVAAFECDGDSFRRMVRNFELNPGLTGRLLPVQTQIGEATGSGSTSLDDFVASGQAFAPAVIKVDVEGAELGVLRGARTVLAECRPHVIVETHSAELEEECAALLQSHGYRPRVVAQRRRLADQRPLEHNRWLVAAGTPMRGNLR